MDQTTAKTSRSFEGKTLSSFISSSALASAVKTVHEHESTQLNAQDARRFFDALAEPAKPNRKLNDALLEHGRRVDSQSEQPAGDAILQGSGVFL